MLRRKDWLVVGLVLLVALGAYGLMRAQRAGQTLSGMVDIYVGGALYTSAPLAQDDTIAVRQGDVTTNTVRIQGGAVWMAHASCRNQHCVQQGTVTADNWTRRALGRTIVCLPNHVLVELSVAEGEMPPGEDMPDL